MRKVKKWRYYCDFCKKASMRGDVIKKHEIGCTMNPLRKCGICEYFGNEQKPIDDLKATVEANGDMCIKPLRELTDNCPACILAAIRQHNKEMDVEDRIWTDEREFNFKTEMQSHWDQVNEDRANERGY